MEQSEKRYLPTVAFLLGIVALLTILNGQSPNSLPNLKLTAFVAGDNLYSDTPKKGYLYSCSDDFSARSLHSGSWFNKNTKYFNLTTKPIVNGSVEWNNSSQYTESGNKHIISTNALPSHPTGQFPPSDEDDAASYDPTGHEIQEQNLVYGLPKNPVVTASPNCVGGEVGVSLDGIPLYSPLNSAGDDPVAHEMLDSCGGRPDEAGIYHYYHLTSCWAGNSTSSAPVVVGYALDGFPIVSERNVDDSSLDICHGKAGTVTIDGEEEQTYYYVATPDFPYLVSCFRGEPIAGPTLALREKAKAEAEAIPRYYSSQDKLLLPYLDQVHGDKPVTNLFNTTLSRLIGF